MCSWTWLLPLMLFLQAVTSNCSVELQDTEVQDLQTQLTASLHQIRVLREQEKFLYEQLEAQKQTVEEALMLVEQLNIRRQLVEFNSTKDWAVLRRSLEEVLDPESAAYKQLQYLKYEETWSMWYIGINGYTELATVLVTGGRDVEVQDTGSGTMLQGAAFSGHTHMVEMLLDHGADMEAVSGAYCRTAIIYAAQACRLDVVKMLAQGGGEHRPGKLRRRHKPPLGGVGRPPRHGKVPGGGRRQYHCHQQAWPHSSGVRHAARKDSGGTVLVPVPSLRSQLLSATDHIYL